MRELCHDVRIEPVLLPVDPNNFSRSANTAEEARLDISGRGVKSAFERTFYDVRVTHPFAPSNVTLPMKQLYEKHEAEKERLYGQRVREVEKGSFDPIVLTYCQPPVEWDPEQQSLSNDWPTRLLTSGVNGMQM